MNSTVSARPSARQRWLLIATGLFALLGSVVVTGPAQAGYYEDSYYGPSPCSYRCGYPVYRHYPVYPYRHYGCYGCGSRVVYERRYVEREYVERRYGYGGYRGYYGCAYGGCRRHYGYYPYGGYPYGGYRSAWRPWGYGYYGIGRRWPAPYFAGYGASGEGYDEPPRPPAPVMDGGEYGY